jgi:dihydroorotate dehydrogenase (fumarate)/dihydroorotate dehydrogenase
LGVYSSLLRPLLFRLDAEQAHELSIRWGSRLAVAALPLRRFLSVEDKRLASEVCGIRFTNPIGLAAGYDKSGEAIDFLAGLGFGHIEIGSVSALASGGNPRPRLFRLPMDQAIVVHYGLQNQGADAVAARLRQSRRLVPLGINLVKTNRGLCAPADSSEQIIEDYLYSVRRLMPLADYLTLNLSCPNTEMGRDFFADEAHVRAFLQALSELHISCPVFLKISPLAGLRGIEMMLQAADGFGFVSGFIFNLPPVKPDGLRTPREVWQNWPGAVSGRPVEPVINQCIRQTYRRMDRRRYRLIGGGGVFDAAQAYRKILLGASLVQLLTGLVYQGPGLVKRINRGLVTLLERDGLDSIADAVGAGNQS